MATLTLNYSFANSVLPLEKFLEQNLSSFQKAKQSLLMQEGLGKEWTDWIPFVTRDSLQIISSQENLVEEIRAHSNAIVVIGIGGSLLGTKAVYEAFTPSFVLSQNSKPSKNPLLFWAGHHMAQDELGELLDVLDHYSPSLVVISKSGSTTETGLAFRMLKDYMEQRFGVEVAQKRIVAITDPAQGTLKSIAAKEGYSLLPVPQGIGGRYSVFSSVGLFPLALAGIDVKSFVLGAIEAKHNYSALDLNVQTDLTLCYAAIRNFLYKNNFKIEALCLWSPKAKGIAEWWKQLFGESDGKNHTGIFPASANFSTDLHSLGQYFQEGERHLFATHIQVKNETSLSAKYKNIELPNKNLRDGFDFLSGKSLSYVQQKAQQGTYLAHSTGGVPTLVWELDAMNEFTLGYWIFSNMLACAIGNYERNINPFDQPGVENYKTNMFALLDKPGWETQGLDTREKINKIKTLTAQ